MVIVTTAVYWGLSSQLRTRRFLPVPLTFQHRAGVSPYTSSCDFARTCVFSKQSLPPGLCGPTPLTRTGVSRDRAPLLPKLRGHFAEFLDHSSLERLGILYLTTCVGLGYGSRRNSLEAFLGSMGSLCFAATGYASRLNPVWCTDLPVHRPTRLHQHYH